MEEIEKVLDNKPALRRMQQSNSSTNTAIPAEVVAVAVATETATSL